ncbi:MAG: RNA-binding protein, partial [Deltaproteobacteria bacterium]|nr:RNA-binding protein [Deltaproteobacteria bacterium]
MNIYVGNLSNEVTEEDLKQAFEPFGEVESVKIIKDK